MKVEDIESAAAGIAGVGILTLCFLGGYAESTREGLSLEALLNPDTDLPGTVRSIVVCFFFTGVVDVIVALVLLAVFFSRMVSASDYPLTTAIAVLAAIFRLAYACVILSCLNGLVQVPKLLALLHESLEKSDMSKLVIQQLWESFHVGFNGVALGLFGFHLALLAVPLARSTKTSTSSCSSFFGGIILPIPLVVAGVGYTGDAVGIFLQDKTFGLTKNGCFMGEILLMGWLLVVWISALWRSWGSSSGSLGNDQLSLE